MRTRPAAKTAKTALAALVGLVLCGVSSAQHTLPPNLAPIVKITRNQPDPISVSSPATAHWVEAGGTKPAASPIPVAVPTGTPVAASSATPSTEVTPVRYQNRVNTDSEDPRARFEIQLDPPGLERLARMDSDAQLQERIRQETKDRAEYDAVTFPEGPVLSRDVYKGRGTAWSRRTMTVEPTFVNYRRLYFEDLNSERYGWDLGIMQPVVSTGKFVYDLALVPMHAAMDPCGRESNKGYCLPGDPVPFLLYPPETSFKGAVAEAAVIVALVAIFP